MCSIEIHVSSSVTRLVDAYQQEQCPRFDPQQCSYQVQWYKEDQKVIFSYIVSSRPA